MKDIDWDALENKTLQAPFIPEVRPPLKDQKPEKETPEVKAANKALLKKVDIQNLWTGYEYDIEQQRHQMIQEKRRTRLESHNDVKKHQRQLSALIAEEKKHGRA